MMVDYLAEIEANAIPPEWKKIPSSCISSSTDEDIAKSACPKAGEIDDDEADLRDAKLKRQIKKGLAKTDLPKWVASHQIQEEKKFRINDLAKEHWSYINSLLDVTMVNETYERDEVLKMIEFHYTTAMIHGWKHAMEVK